MLTVLHIEKETNLIQEEEGVLLDGPQAVYPGGGEWETIRRWLHRVSLAELSKETGIRERRLREYRQGAQNASKSDAGHRTNPQREIWKG